MTTNITETNFTDIRDQIIAFFQTKSEFTDYNFAGSASSVLIDVLAYNAYYKNVYSNLAFNETFLDTANQRQSVVSRAKELGYLPRSKQASKAQVRLTFNVTGNPVQYILPKNTRFSASIDGTTYTFVTTEDNIFNNISNSFSKTIEISQGVLTNYEYTFNSNDLSQRFIIPSKDVDLNYLTVSKKDSSSDTTYDSVRDLTELDLSDVTSETDVYILTEEYDGFYKAQFGDGVLGKELTNNNVIRFDYLITDGSEANGAQTFALESSLSGVSNIVLTTIETSSGGSEKETVDSIKYNAPLFYESRNRAVTENDYRSIVLSKYGNIDDVITWGGEKNNPPAFGKVFVAIKPKTGTFLSQNQKNSISNDILTKYNVIGIRPEITDPEYIYVYVDVSITYNANLVTRSNNTQIETDVQNAIETFFTNNVNKFGQSLFFSKLATAIDASNTAIKHSITNIILKKELEIVSGIPTEYKFTFNNAIAPNSVESNEIDIGGVSYFVKDVPQGTSPYVDGNLTVYRTVGGTDEVFIADAGSVSYNTGEVIFENFKIDDIPNDPINKLFSISVSQGNFVDPDDVSKIVTDYNVYTNERDEIITLGDIEITLVADNS